MLQLRMLQLAAALGPVRSHIGVVMRSRLTLPHDVGQRIACSGCHGAQSVHYVSTNREAEAGSFTRAVFSSKRQCLLHRFKNASLFTLALRPRTASHVRLKAAMHMSSRQQGHESTN